MIYDFQAILDSNLTIQQHNAVIAMRDARCTHHNKVWEQNIIFREAVNALNMVSFNEGLGVA
jgi:hypothetical protein